MMHFCKKYVVFSYRYYSEESVATESKNLKTEADHILMEREPLCHKSGETGVQKWQTSTSTVDSNSRNWQARTPSKTRTYVASTNLLPSKFEKLPFRPLPPLEGSSIAVHKDDSHTSFKPAKSSDRGSQPKLPLKGQHLLSMPTHNSSVQTAHQVIKVKTASQHEAENMESKHTAAVDNFHSAKNKSKTDKLPAPLQRSHSVSRLSGSSKPKKLPDSFSPLFDTDTRPSRSTTPQHLAVEKNSDTTTNGRVSSEAVYASNKSKTAVAQVPRRRSSSVSSSARVPLQRSNSFRTSSPLSLERINVDVDDSAVNEGKQSSNSALETILQITARSETSQSQNAAERLPSDHQTVRSKSLELATTTDVQSYEVKLLDKSSSHHGILGGKSDDKESMPVKSAVSIGQKSSLSSSRCNSMVSVNHYFYLLQGGGYVVRSICLSFYLSVSRIIAKVIS